MRRSLRRYTNTSPSLPALELPPHFIATQRLVGDPVPIVPAREARVVASPLHFGVPEAENGSPALTCQAPESLELAIRVDCQLDPGLPLAYLDPDRMKQVVLNLLDNAIKFSPNGSEIGVRTEGREGSLQFRVRNSSSELREGDLSRIFARFVQRDGSFTRRHGGVGLGLDLVRAIIERHGGRVWGEFPALGQVEFIAEIPLSER